MSVYNCALFGGAFITPVFVGKITHTIGWQWTFYVIALATGTLFPLVYFFLPETDFPRPDAAYEGQPLALQEEDYLDTLEGLPRLLENATVSIYIGQNNNAEVREHTCLCGDSHHGYQVSKEEDKSYCGRIKALFSTQRQKDKAAKRAMERATKEAEIAKVRKIQKITSMRADGACAAEIEEALNVPPKRQHRYYKKSSTPDHWRERIRIFTGKKTGERMFSLTLKPFPLFLHPAVLWAVLIQGTMIGWTVLIGVVLAAVFYGPPLFLSEVHTGYLYTGAFIGSLVGFFTTGLWSDGLNWRLVMANNGCYEPELRIVLVIPQFVFSTIGLFGFAITTNNIGHYGTIIPAVFFGFVVAGMVSGTVASALYMVDAYGKFYL
jgi:Major Facilitator Superfamily